jgi:hypothetical protein
MERASRNIIIGTIIIVACFCSGCKGKTVDSQVMEYYKTEDLQNVYHIDLMYHLFSYMDIGTNAASVFSEDYVNDMEDIKKKMGYDNDTKEKMISLSKYFKDNFSDLQYIYFIPFDYKDYDSFSHGLLNEIQYPDKYRKDFYEPLMEVAEQEKDFYKKYWEKKRQEDTKVYEDFCNYLNTNFTSINGLFQYTGCTPKVILSYSMNRNGRGYTDKNGNHLVAVLSPEKDNFTYSYFFILHEFTHNVTDPIINNEVAVNSGEHEIIESLAIYFDYLLLKKENPEMIDSYLKTSSQAMGLNYIIGEQEFKEKFCPDAAYEKTLQKIIDEIAYKKNE